MLASGGIGVGPGGAVGSGTDSTGVAVAGTALGSSVACPLHAAIPKNKVDTANKVKILCFIASPKSAFLVGGVGKEIEKWVDSVSICTQYKTRIPQTHRASGEFWDWTDVQSPAWSGG
jgi:hypothetical protein